MIKHGLFVILSTLVLAVAIWAEDPVASFFAGVVFGVAGYTGAIRIHRMTESLPIEELEKVEKETQ